MKRIIIISCTLLLIGCGILYGQKKAPSMAGGPSHTWWVIDAGGGKATNGSMMLSSSIGQPAAGEMSATTFILEGGYIPGMRSLSGSFTAWEIQLDTGWNLMSVPLVVEDYRKAILFPTSVSPAFCYELGYVPEDTLAFGCGYWLKFPDAQPETLSGVSILSDTIPVNARWNIVGPVSYPVLVTDITRVPPTMTLKSVFYGFNRTEGYYEEDTLKPGKGYWISVSEAGGLVMPSGHALAASKTLVDVKGGKKSGGGGIKEILNDRNFDRLVFTDAAGRKHELYFSSKSHELDLEKFELPPPPPAGMFDVRFASQRIAEFPDVNKGVQEYPIRMTGATDPVRVGWDIGEGEYTLEITTGTKKAERIALRGTNTAVLQTSQLLSIKLLITPAGEKEIPKEFALHQNYPNPFNPQTIILYDLPIDAKVVITIYDVLGREVERIIDGEQDAGQQSVEYVPAMLASGIYFYRIDAVGIRDQGRKFSEVKKMLLLR